MAKVSAHGHEVGTVYFTTSAKRYMSDGTILKNHGFGWKLGGKLKADVTPQEAFKNQAEKQNILLSERPALAAYRKALHDLAGLSKRWKLHAAVSMMPEDPDGVWSEACDGYSDNVSADIDEVVNLCRVFKVAEMEAKAVRVEKEIALPIANPVNHALRVHWAGLWPKKAIKLR